MLEEGRGIEMGCEGKVGLVITVTYLVFLGVGVGPRGGCEGVSE